MCPYCSSGSCLVKPACVHVTVVVSQVFFPYYMINDWNSTPELTFSSNLFFSCLQQRAPSNPRAIVTNTITKIENRQVQPVAGSDFHKSVSKVCGYVTSSMDLGYGSGIDPSHTHSIRLHCTSTVRFASNALIRSRFHFHSRHWHWKNVLCCL